MRFGAAPDADDQVHRDQAGLEEDVEEEDVLRHEDADHQRLHEQEARPYIRARASRSRPSDAAMQIGIRKTESMISIRAMPSMPSAQAKRPNRSAHARRTAIAAPPIS